MSRREVINAASRGASRPTVPRQRCGCVNQRCVQVFKYLFWGGVNFLQIGDRVSPLPALHSNHRGGGHTRVASATRRKGALRCALPPRTKRPPRECYCPPAAQPVYQTKRKYALVARVCDEDTAGTHGDHAQVAACATERGLRPVLANGRAVRQREQLQPLAGILLPKGIESLSGIGH